jgi:energy-coupling factor transporter ATP-binding protein EcfA2
MSHAPGFRRAIRLRGVSRTFRAGAGSCFAEVSALDETTLEIRAGEVVIVAGPAGSGKTTLLLCAAGLLRCDGGMIDGGLSVVYRDLTHPSPRLDGWPSGSAVLLDSVDRIAPNLTDALATRIDQALAARCAIVLAATIVEPCLRLLPAATVTIVHLRLGRLVAPGAAVVHRVAEGGGY